MVMGYGGMFFLKPSENLMESAYVKHIISAWYTTFRFGSMNIPFNRPGEGVNSYLLCKVPISITNCSLKHFMTIPPPFICCGPIYCIIPQVVKFFSTDGRVLRFPSPSRDCDNLLNA